MGYEPKARKRNAATPSSQRGSVLVCVVTNIPDWRILREQLWYRIPVDKAPKRWPPAWIAFYQTKCFRDEAYSVRYYGKVKQIDRKRRVELLPHQPDHSRAQHEYYQVHIEELLQLERPIVSQRFRRVVFIPTTERKLHTATLLNDLYDDSPLEDALWLELKRMGMETERQWDVYFGGRRYALDFSVVCQQGKIDIETDGDSWHRDPNRIAEDNRRNNAMAALGYQVLRFNSMQVKEEMATYCVPHIVETVEQLGGIAPVEGAPYRYFMSSDGIVQQFTLFENRGEYGADDDSVEAENKERGKGV